MTQFPGVDLDNPREVIRSVGIWFANGLTAGNTGTLYGPSGPTPQIRWLGFLASANRKDAIFKFEFNSGFSSQLTPVPFHHIGINIPAIETTRWIPIDVITPIDAPFEAQITHLSHSTAPATDFHVMYIVEIEAQDLAAFLALHL